MSCTTQSLIQMLKSNQMNENTRHDPDQNQTKNMTDNNSYNKRVQSLYIGQTFKRERKSNILDEDTGNAQQQMSDLSFGGLGATNTFNTLQQTVSDKSNGGFLGAELNNNCTMMETLESRRENNQFFKNEILLEHVFRNE